MTSNYNHSTIDSPIYLSDMVVFDQTYKSYYHPLCFYASKFVGRNEAEDIIENLFLKFWNRKQVFKDTAHMQASLYQSVRNACLDFLRSPKNKNHIDTTILEAQSSATENHLSLLIKAEVMAEIYRAVNDLPSQCSKVIRMGYLEGLNNSEIAKELGLSEQTVKNYKGRGLSLLKDKLSGSAFTMLLLLITWK
ncbi:RNA polymerase sigma-70 factor (ECF subfamily) [Mucilaginibacter gracilis]|uniref:RNA polymerase sigma-70 factor (ECF subfamily) n=1 Tax=Mucilaginibacter gracilis TaxID=423350 RepID=A0A495ITB6_9SPHI|nr:RNA polymerase sigma-70 factor [Mucilaginibacter gracilis]RKR79997.1 RNA polymerase sigma-70 factor (ECF subfamily) [Mucilaginibacter gracilis]